MSPRLLVAPGPRSTQWAVFRRLDEVLAEGEADPGLLARPVRLVVPSHSLRLHLGAAYLRHRGRAVLGLEIQTLFHLARDVLERSGEALPTGRQLFSLLPQRAARREPVLRQSLDDLVDGYGTVVESVRDLLDAGFEPSLEEALVEILADPPHPLPASAAERAQALLRVASETFRQLHELRFGQATWMLRRATERLEADGAEALPCRALLVHGFADATGIASDLLQALQRHLEAEVFLDRPVPPGEAASAGDPRLPLRPFGERFVERLARLAPAEAAEAPPLAAPRWRSFTARGAEGEVRELVLRLRRLLDGGAAPEGIGVVARDLLPYRLELRRQLPRFGIPFSGHGTRGSLEPEGRRLRALLDLLRRGPALPTERWLDALEGLPGGRRPPRDLRLAFAALGAGRLGQAAAVEVERYLRGGRYALPIRQGLTAGADEEASPQARAPRRSLRGDLLTAAVAAADAVCKRLAAWPQQAPLNRHLEELEQLLVRDLGWSKPPTLADELPGDFVADYRELTALASRIFSERGVSDLAGRGAGVQVLTVTEARGRTFEHLFVLGLNRDLFPRTVSEDPLLPDAVRSVLRELVPDLALKRLSGLDEERFLFAQLLHAADEVTLSWQLADDDGGPRTPSPLLATLPPALQEAQAAPAPWMLPGASPTEPTERPSPVLRPAAEHALSSALAGPRQQLPRLLTAALEEGAGGSWQLPVTASAVAAGRMAVLDELDPDLSESRGRKVDRDLGPYLGALGPVHRREDPRRRDLFITVLEGMARCPWQTLVERLLGIEPAPDPLAALPGITPLLLGNVVHGVLEELASQAGVARAEDLAAAAAAAPTPVAWPDGAALDELLHRHALVAVAEEGIGLSGLAVALAEIARPFLDAAQEDWSEGGGALPVVGVELRGSLPSPEIEGAEPRRLFFAADRVNLGPQGQLRLTDYKTGKNRWDLATEKGRRNRLLTSVSRGEALQAAAYQRSGATFDPGAEGRYLFLSPASRHRSYLVGSESDDLQQAFDAALRTLLAAWEAGTFLPRLLDPGTEQEPQTCSSCPVAEACLRGDSGVRRRLAAYGERRVPTFSAASSWLDLWHLGTGEAGE